MLYVGRPAFGQPGAAVSLFRLDPTGDEAVRVPVRLGRASVNFIEIRGGLGPGDRVVLSDTPAAEGQERIRIGR